MTYSVKQLAVLAGVSPRTLHHYDALGLLVPSRVEKNGYRLYGQADLLRLQQILFYRELDFSLDDIKRILESPQYRLEQAFQDQKKLLQLKRTRLDKLIQTLDTTMHAMHTNQPLPDEQLYDAFKDPDVAQYQNEVRERWGNTDAYKQSMARVGKMTKAQMEKLKADGHAFTARLAQAMDKPVDSAEVQALIAEHYKGIQFFYDCPLPMYRGLGQMYVDDPRFTAYYDKHRPGLAVFVRDAIAVFCDRGGVI